jgi:single-stranded DNA-specific DHH superfamily exonuclease
MLSQTRLNELRARLEGASCPAFLFDNDADGLCSFLLAHRALGKGFGIPVRSYPALDVGYGEQALTRGADLLVVLDKPVLSEAFVLFAKEHHLPLLSIDHHAIDKPDWKMLYADYEEYNPALLSGKGKSDEPVSYIVYHVFSRSEDLWLMVAGCIADHYLPVEWNAFSKQYPSFGGKVSDPFEAYYTTPLGDIVQACNFGLKDSLSAVKKLLAFLSSCAHPSLVLSEQAPSSFLEKNASLRAELERLLGESVQRGPLHLVQYSGPTSMSADVANKLTFLYPGSYVLVAYQKGSLTNLSLRGKRVKELFTRLLPSFSGLIGGGHAEAVGGRIPSKDVASFITAFEKELT